MNGRIYDPLLGRFLSADLIVDGPGDLQGYNRYSYVRNNPLSLVDPSGWSGLFPVLPLFITPDNVKDTGKAVADSVAESFNHGKAHAEAGAQEFANASNSSTPGLDRTIGALHMVGVVAAGVDIAATFTPEGKVKEAAVGAVEKMATKAEAAVSQAVSKAEGAAAKLEGKVATAEKRIEGVETGLKSEVPKDAPKSGAQKETGSYTNHHESGKTYDGKGDRARSQTSARRVENETGDKHTATEWKPAENNREAFKDESKRLDSHGGSESAGNHNKIESPGKKLRKEDGELPD